MEKSKGAYINYVCPYCWHTVDNCTCDLFPPYHLVFIDRNIQEHIRILNEKGYFTTYCCEGHKDVCFNTYITFARNYFEDMDKPEGFKYDKKSRMISYSHSAKLTEEEMEESKRVKLKSLLKWCKSLPRNTEN